MPNYQKGVFGVFPLLIYSRITKSTKIPKYLKCCVPCFALAYATIRSVRQMADVWLTYRPPNIVLLFTNVLYLGVTRALAGEGVRTTWQMFLMQLPLEAVLRVVDSGNVYSLFGPGGCQYQRFSQDFHDRQPANPARQPGPTERCTCSPSA